MLRKWKADEVAIFSFLCYDDGIKRKEMAL